MLFSVGICWLLKSFSLNSHNRLLGQADSIDGDLSQASKQLAQIKQERIFLTRQAKKRLISEGEYEMLMKETEKQKEYWQGEIERLQELRDNEEILNDSINYAVTLMESLQENLSEINQGRKELKKLSPGQQKQILLKRQKIVRSLCEKVFLFPDGNIKIEGVLDTGLLSDFVSVDLVSRCQGFVSMPIWL